MKMDNLKFAAECFFPGTLENDLRFANNCGNMGMYGRFFSLYVKRNVLYATVALTAIAAISMTFYSAPVMLTGAVVALGTGLTVKIGYHFYKESAVLLQICKKVNKEHERVRTANQ